MKHDSLTYALNQLKKAANDLINAVDATTPAQYRYVYNLDEHKHLYPFSQDPHELKKAIEAWSNEVQDRLSRLNVDNSIEFQQCIILTAMGLDMSENNYGKSFVLHDEDRVYTFNERSLNYRGSHQYSYKAVLPTAFGTMTYTKTTTFGETDFYREILGLITNTKRAFETLQTKDRYKMINNLSIKTGFAVHAENELGEYGKRGMRFKRIKIQSDEYKYNKTYEYWGDFREEVRSMREAILKHKETMDILNSSAPVEATA